jgi:Tol biopolymer transport system component
LSQTVNHAEVIMSSLTPLPESPRRVRGTFVPWAAALGNLALFACVSLRAALGPLQAVSLADPGLSGSASAGGDSAGSVVSRDGSFLIFMSDAGDLVPGDVNGLAVDIFRWTRSNGGVTLVSEGLAGRGGGNGDSFLCDFTPDGRWVAFESSASDLVEEDANGVSDVFVRDLVRGETALVSVNPAGRAANGASSDAVMTPDGRYVAFISAASDLVPGDTNGLPDVFVRDLQAGTTTLVSVGATRSGSGGIEVEGPAISVDGRWVAFASTASNLVAGVGRQGYEVYVRDLAAGTTRLASTNVAAVFTPASTTPPQSYGPVLSGDGRWVAFKTLGTGPGGGCQVLRRDLQTDALEVVASHADFVLAGAEDGYGPVMTPDGRFVAYVWTGAAPAVRTVYLWDAQAAAAEPISVDVSGVTSTTGPSDGPALSADGRFVAFRSSGTDLVTNAVNAETQVYIRDRETGTTRLVTADPAGEGSGSALISLPTLSDDGRFVAFDSDSAVYVAGDRNGSYDVFERDLVSDTTALVSRALPGQGAFTAGGPSKVGADCVSADGRWVVFTSLAGDLVVGDTNGLQDVYVRDLQSSINLLVSVGLGGASTSAPSTAPVISADGRSVAFVCAAPNLVAGETNQVEDVFVRDLAAGKTCLVSVNLAGTGSGNGRSQAPALSGNGRRVAFQSTASNLVANDTDSSDDIFVRDLDTGITTLVSDQVPGEPPGAAFSAPRLSPDGRFVVFSGMYGGLAVRDLNLGTVARVGATNLGAVAMTADSRWLVFASFSPTNELRLNFFDLRQLTNDSRLVWVPAARLSGAVPVSVNRDGRFVAFSCRQPLSRDDTNQVSDVLLYDAATDNLTLVSVNRDGTASAEGVSDSPALSADGRFVAFRSQAVDLVRDPANGWSDIFLYDRLTGRNTLVSADRLGLGSGNQWSSGPVLAGADDRIVFRSGASDLVAGDDNATEDVFTCAFAPEAVVAAPHPTFDCQAVSTGPTETELRWGATPGHAYRVQFKDDLGAATWADLPGTVAVLGRRAAFVDVTMRGAGQRFYRVVVVD